MGARIDSDYRSPRSILNFGLAQDSVFEAWQFFDEDPLESLCYMIP